MGGEPNRKPFSPTLCPGLGYFNIHTCVCELVVDGSPTICCIGLESVECGNEVSVEDTLPNVNVGNKATLDGIKLALT